MSVLPAPARQQHLERRQQHHEQRRALAAAPVAQRPASAPPAARSQQPRAAIALHRRPRTVGRQAPAPPALPQLLLPVRELLLQHLALQPVALPQRIVRILHRQARGSGDGCPCAERRVQRAQLPASAPPSTSRPTTMWCIVTSSTCSSADSRSKSRAEQRTSRQIERLP